MSGERITRLAISPAPAIGGLTFRAMGARRACRRTYPAVVIENASFNIGNLIVRDFATDGFDVSEDQEGMITMAVAAWRDQHRTEPE